MQQTSMETQEQTKPMAVTAMDVKEPKTKLWVFYILGTETGRLASFNTKQDLDAWLSNQVQVEIIRVIRGFENPIRKGIRFL